MLRQELVPKITYVDFVLCAQILIGVMIVMGALGDLIV